jgi:hypothetical protein
VGKFKPPQEAAYCSLGRKPVDGKISSLLFFVALAEGGMIKPRA